MTNIRLNINGKYFSFTKDAIDALNTVLALEEVQVLETNYRNGEYEYTVSPDARKQITVVQTTEWAS